MYEVASLDNKLSGINKRETIIGSCIEDLNYKIKTQNDVKLTEKIICDNLRNYNIIELRLLSFNRLKG